MSTKTQKQEKTYNGHSFYTKTGAVNRITLAASLSHRRYGKIPISLEGESPSYVDDSFKMISSVKEEEFPSRILDVFGSISTFIDTVDMWAAQVATWQNITKRRGCPDYSNLVFSAARVVTRLESAFKKLSPTVYRAAVEKYKDEGFETVYQRYLNIGNYVFNTFKRILNLNSVTAITDQLEILDRALPAIVQFSDEALRVWKPRIIALSGEVKSKRGRPPKNREGKASKSSMSVDLDDDQHRTGTDDESED